MAYVIPDVNEYLPGEPWTAAKALAGAQNPGEIASGATDAPVVQAAWHPVDAVTYGDGNTGVIWDFATDSTFTTIDYIVEAGYEYCIMCEDYAGPTMTLRGRMTENNTFADWLQFGSGTQTFRVEIYTPNVVRDDHMAKGIYSQGGTATAVNETIRNTNGTAIDVIRVSTAVATQTAGTIRMYRRLSYR